MIMVKFRRMSHSCFTKCLLGNVANIVSERIGELFGGGLLTQETIPVHDTREMW